MRFPKQLATICVLALTSATASAETNLNGLATCQASGRDDCSWGLFDIFGVMATMQVTDSRLDGDTQLPPYTKYLEADETTQQEMYNSSDVMSGFREGQVDANVAYGITVGGKKVTLYCQESCTPGSLNRHALISGVPMMVPVELFKSELTKKYGESDVSQAEKEAVWLAVAAVTWSETWATNDRNSDSAREHQINRPGMYADAKKTLANSSSNKSPNILFLGARDDSELDAASELGDTVAVIATDGNILVIDNTTAEDLRGAAADQAAARAAAAAAAAAARAASEAADPCGPLTYDCP